MFKKKKAFTILEITLVIIVIGIMMAGMTIYLGGYDEKRTVIEAQGCVSTIGGEITNYVFFALTSKNLRITDSQTVSPKLYTIGLSGGTSSATQPCNVVNASGHNTLCDKLIFGYKTGLNIETYKEINVRNTCRQNQPHLGFFRSGGNDIENVVMNKGFTTMNLNDPNTFYLEELGSKKLLGDIIIVLCNNNDCSTKKEIAKRIADGRSQTISQHNCAFYEDDGFKCKEREN